MNLQEMDRITLGKLIPTGEDAPRVTEETAPYWCIRAENGDVNAQYQVGCFLVEHYPDKWAADIERYFHMAADSDAGHGPACFALGKWKLRGNPKHAPKAIEWLESAQSDGILEAAELLGICYAKGIGVQADPEKAETHFVLFGKNGDGEAKLSLALRYKRGDCLPKRVDEAQYWLGRAEKAGVLDAEQRFNAAE